MELRLAQLAASLTVNVVDQIEAGTVQQLSQDPSLVTRAPRLTKADGIIDWSQSANRISRHLRAMQPWPMAFAYLIRSGTAPLRVIVLEVATKECDAERSPGIIVQADHRQLVVQVGGRECVEIVRLKPEGKRAMSAAEFLHGHAVRAGDRLAAEPEAG